VQRKAFDDGDSFTREEMRAKNKAAGTAAAAEKSAREQERHDSNAHGQPETTPEVNEEFVGTCIEVLTEIEEVQVDEKGKEVLDDEGNEVMVYSKQWLPAEVMKLSTGGEKKKNKTGNMVKVQVGWVLLDYDDGASLWARLRPNQFNCTAVGSWRLDLDQEAENVGATGAASETVVEVAMADDASGGGVGGSSEEEELSSNEEDEEAVEDGSGDEGGAESSEGST
jgi:hypothetical protein